MKYYDIVEGNLRTGDIAKSSDINHVQVNIQDAFQEFMNDLHRTTDGGDSFILGAGEAHKYDFILTPAQKTLGRYMDFKVEFEEDVTKYININRADVKQPILLTKTSVYSVITKFKNESNKDISVRCELQDEDENVLKANTIVIPARTITPAEFEVVFDLDHYPTAPNLNPDDLEKRDGADIPYYNPKEENYDEGFEHNREEDENPLQGSIGVSKLYFVIKRTNLNAIDLVESNGIQVDFDPDTSLGVFYTEESPFSDKDIYCSISKGTDYNLTNWNIYTKVIYANSTTYLCRGGEAIIGGEKVRCLDTHIEVDGGSTYGNILTAVYMDREGRLRARNSQANFTTSIDDFKEDIDDPMPEAFLPIALILTYSNIYGLDKEPLIIQSQEAGQLPLSHHERIRRIEKQIDWSNDIAIPSRLKYTITGEDWIDKTNTLSGYPATIKVDSNNKEDASYFISTDSEGNPVVRLSESKITTIPITLKENFKGKDGNEILLAENDLMNASYLAKKSNIVHNSSKGTLVLDKTKKKTTTTTKVAVTKKEAKETEYNPWDDYKGNRPASSKLKKHKRKFTVVKGKNGRNDFDSKYPAMTFYTKTNYKMSKLNIPIYEFENCSGIQFFIWKRQGSNNKTNTVWLEKKIKTTKVFSLKKAKTKNGHQYMENGFTIDFGKSGLSLPKGQYVIICLPIPKSGEGSCWVETYKPQNPKDFLITYHGAANASHFLLKTRDAEVWYNPAKATVVEEVYESKGYVESRTITWTDEESMERIESIRPIINKTMDTPKNCKFVIKADTGGGWVELQPDKENPVTGGGKTFKWMIEFYGDGKNSPTLKYNKSKGYALEFVLTRAKPGVMSNNNQAQNLNKNMCLTGVPFNGNDILRKYVGDPSLGTVTSKFKQYEFARIWADPNMNNKLLIDIQGADKYINGTTTPFWTYHYCDLTLDDFSQTSVDYSHYEEDVEYDENNLRLKLDSEHSYNDNDIIISSLEDFKKASNEIDTSDSTKISLLSPNESVTKNQVVLKSTFKNPYDLTKYTGLRFRFRIYGSNADKVKGLALYISSSENPEITTKYDDLENKENVLTDTEVLPPVIDPETSSAYYYSPNGTQISYSNGKIIVLKHEVDKYGTGNKAVEDCYYRYVQKYDSENNKTIYVLEQIHDIKEYKVYKLKEIEFLEANKLVDDNNNHYNEYTARIELDENSQILRYTKEIGLALLVDDGDNSYKVTTGEESGGMSIELVDVRALSEDYYTIFSPGKDINLFTKVSDNVDIHEYNDITLDATTFLNNGIIYNFKTTNPETVQLAIKHQSLPNTGEVQLCYINNPYEGGLSNYKHLGIQLASDVYIPKDCIKIQLCEKVNGESPIVSVNLPTLNSVFYPSESTANIISLSQIFKKINSEKEIKSINIVATKYLKTFMKDIVVNGKDWINLFIGKIVLYKAETIPMFHENMRFKFYSAQDGQIEHSEQEITNETINVRKIGTVVDYS